MKKKLFTLFSVFALLLTSIGNIHAAPTTYIIDELDVLNDDEMNRLNDKASKINEEFGISIYFALLDDSDLASVDLSTIVGNQKDYYIMVENKDYWISYAEGIMEEKLTDTNRDDIRSVYDEEDTYFEGIDTYYDYIEKLIVNKKLSVLTSSSQDNVIDKVSNVVKTTSNLYDGADLLSVEEEKELNAEITAMIDKHNVDIAIATVKTTGNKAIDDYIAEYYDINGFGTGENRDGVLFLISMSERQYRILSNGLGAQAISSDDISSIGNNIVSDLTDGNYASAFHTFLSDCEYEINGEINGFPFPFTMNAIIAAVGGFIVSLFTTGSMKNQLKSVAKQNKAKDYMKPGSMKLNNSNEFFLYRTVSSQRKLKNNSSSSSGRSGSSRNVGGGSF